MPVVASLVVGGHPGFHEIIHVLYGTIGLSIIAAYFHKYFTAFRLFAFIVLGFGTFVATGISTGGWGAPSTNLMLAIINTDPQESAEFVRGTFGLSAYLLEASLLIPLVSVVVQRHKNVIWRPRNLLPGVAAVLLLFIFTIRIGIFHSPLMSVVANLPEPFPVYFTLATAFQKQAAISAIGKNDSPISGITIAKSQRRPRTYVVVIGESESKHHMHLYGYYRQTTPHLDSLAANNDLIVFTDAVTSHAETVPALTEALTVSVGDRRVRHTIFQILSAAGIKTYWLSNQAAFSVNSIWGVWDTGIALLSHSATVHKWVRLNRNGNMKTVNWGQKYRDLDRNYQFDSALLPYLREALAHKDENKVVFLHLIGNHLMYRFRYPVEAKTVFDHPSRSCLSEHEAEVVDEYDNSVHYTDYILNKIISATREAGGDSLVLYLSDHGEEIYDFRKFFGHGDDRMSPYLDEVPMVLWLSPTFRQRHPKAAASLAVSANCPLWTGDLSYALADLVGVGFPGMDPSRSIFSKQFRARTRMTSGRDYDAYRSSWRPDVAHANPSALSACAKDVQLLANSGR